MFNFLLVNIYVVYNFRYRPSYVFCYSVFKDRLRFSWKISLPKLNRKCPISLYFFLYFLLRKEVIHPQDVYKRQVPDALIPKNAEINEIYWNIDLSSKTSCEKFDKYFDQQRSKLYEESSGEDVFPAFMRSSKQDVYDMNKGMAVTFTYIGIYLGTVFMIASAVILALQQLSQANDNKKRYLILSKIGTEQRMINRSILLQIAIYFMMPLALAIVLSLIHS